jgi:hypothetical protein
MSHLPFSVWAGLGIVLVVIILAGILIFEPELSHASRPAAPVSGRVPVAVLGDSDSHLYRDHVNGLQRGGDFHAVTFQWTEIWDRLRADEVDLGKLDVWGSHGRIAQIRSFLGLETKTPKKYDFRFNYAYSGEKCASLLTEYPFQTRWLLGLMDLYPQLAAELMVIIRIGVNDFGQLHHLDNWAKSGLDATARGVLDGCVENITQATRLIQQHNPSTRVVLIGIAYEYNAFGDAGEKYSKTQLENIASVLGYFDDRLNQLAARSDNIAFAYDFLWFRQRWGDRLSGGLKQEVSLGGSVAISNSVGDHPSHLILNDNHAGTIYNGLWLQGMIRQINDQFGLGLTPLLEAEITDLADPDGNLGITPARTDNTNNRIQFSGIRERWVFAADSLPAVLHSVAAVDAEGLDVTDSITAYLETETGTQSF